MKQRMRERRLSPFFLFALLAFLLAGCGGGPPAVSWFGVTADDDMVFVSANEQVFALNLESGAELWAFPPASDSEVGPFYASPLLINDQVIVGGYGDNKLYLLSRDDGEKKWEIETQGAIVAGAATADGGVVVGNGQGEVLLVDLETQEAQSFLEAGEAIWAKPLVDPASGRLYVPAMDHRLYALDLDSGQQLWSFKAGAALVGTPALSDGVLYFGALNNILYVIDAEDGTELWRFETSGWVWGGPLVHDGTVYFGDMGGKLFALDVTDASERWPAFEADGGIRVTPLLSDGMLYFGTRNKKLYAVNAANGSQEWMLPLSGSIYSQPAIRDDYLLVSPYNAKVKLLALDKESGAERWAYPRREE